MIGYRIMIATHLEALNDNDTTSNVQSVCCLFSDKAKQLHSVSAMSLCSMRCCIQ